MLLTVVMTSVDMDDAMIMTLVMTIHVTKVTAMITMTDGGDDLWLHFVCVYGDVYLWVMMNITIGLLYLFIHLFICSFVCFFACLSQFLALPAIHAQMSVHESQPIVARNSVIFFRNTVGGIGIMCALIRVYNNFCFLAFSWTCLSHFYIMLKETSWFCMVTPRGNSYQELSITRQTDLHSAMLMLA